MECSDSSERIMALCQKIKKLQNSSSSKGRQKLLSKALDDLQACLKGSSEENELRQKEPAEEALRKSEERYRPVVEGQTELICRSLPDGTLTFVNDAFCRYVGKKREELIGHSLVTLIPEEIVGQVKRHLQSLGPEKPVGAIELHASRNGEVRWQQWTDRAILDERGQVIEFQTVGRDITELKLAEEALREKTEEQTLLLENIETQIWYLTDIKTYGAVNKAHADFLGVNKEYLEEKSLYDVVSKQEAEVCSEFENPIGIEKAKYCWIL
jgi:PAS domain S-box-containing protein